MQWKGIATKADLSLNTHSQLQMVWALKWSPETPSTFPPLFYNVLQDNRYLTFGVSLKQYTKKTCIYVYMHKCVYKSPKYNRHGFFKEP